MKIKNAWLLVLFLGSVSCSTYNVQQVVVGGSERSLVASNKENYFCIYLYYSTNFDIYFYLKDNSYGLIEPIFYCITDNIPTSDSAINNCKFNSLYSKSTSGPKKNFKINLGEISPVKFVIVRYKGKYTSGSLYVKSSFGDDIFDLVNSPLSIFAIVGIVIGSIFFLSVLITVLCCVFRRKRINGGIGYISPQHDIVVTTPLTAN